MLCPFLNNSNKIELTVYTSCYWGLRLALCCSEDIFTCLIWLTLFTTFKSHIHVRDSRMKHGWIPLFSQHIYQLSLQIRLAHSNILLKPFLFIPATCLKIGIGVQNKTMERKFINIFCTNNCVTLFIDQIQSCG